MNVYVAATSQIRFGEHWDQGIEDLAGEALTKLWTESDYGPDDIDAIYLANTFGERFLGLKSLGAHLANRLGLALPIVEVGGGDAAGSLAIQQAARMIASNQYERVLVLGIEKASDQLAIDIQSALASLLDAEEIFYGQTMAGAYALMARDYLRLFDASLADLAQVSYKNHQNAAINPLAQFQFNLPLEQIMASSEVASPLRLLDGASFCDGAAAIILERVADNKHGVRLTGTGYGLEQLALADRRSIIEMQSTQQAAQEAYQMAGIEAKQISLAEVHDVFTISELLAMEDLGFCHHGQAVTLLREGKTALDGSLPINPSGGLKACGHAGGATGVRQAIEIITQLLGTAGERQVKQGESGLTQTLCGSGSECVVNIFKRG